MIKQDDEKVVPEKSTSEEPEYYTPAELADPAVSEIVSVFSVELN